MQGIATTRRTADSADRRSPRADRDRAWQAHPPTAPPRDRCTARNVPAGGWLARPAARDRGSSAAPSRDRRDGILSPPASQPRMTVFRRIPSIEQLLRRPALDRAAMVHGREIVTSATRRAVDELRARLATDESAATAEEDVTP